MDFEIPVGDEQDNKAEKIEITNQESAFLRIYFNGDLDHLTFFKADNKKVHEFNYFAAKVYLSQDNENDILIIGNGQPDVEKIIYYVCGENTELTAKFGKVWVYSDEYLYHRFQDKISEDMEYILEEAC